MSHTPGPWVVDNTNAFGVYGVWTDYATHPGHDGAGYGSQICSMFTESFGQIDKNTRAERDANAKLIAAAPDLLAALKSMVEQGDRCNWFADSLDEEIKAKAVAAIEKAGSV